MTWQNDYSRDYEVKNHMECQNRSDKYIWSPHDAYFYKGLSELIVDIDRLIYLSLEKIRKDFVFINLSTDSLSEFRVEFYSSPLQIFPFKYIGHEFV